MRQNVSDIIKRVRRIEISARKNSEESLAGEYLSAFKGDGSSFAELREYVPGDDTRRLDAFASAKRNKPFVRVYSAERELNLIFLIDCGAKMRFGSGDKLKIELAAEIFASLAFSAAKTGDKIGVALFDDSMFKFYTPAKGYKQILACVESILAYEQDFRETAYAKPLAFINKSMKKNSVVFLISDFIKPTLGSEIKICAQKFDLTAIKIYDDNDYVLPSLGLSDIMGKGKDITVDGADATQQADLIKLREKDDKILTDAAGKYGFKVLKINARENYYLALRNYFKNRIKRGTHGLPKRKKLV